MHTCRDAYMCRSFKGVKHLNGESFEPHSQALLLSTNMSQSEKNPKFGNFPFVIFDLPRLRAEPKIHQELHPGVCMLSLYICVQRLYQGIKALTVVFSLSSKSFHVMYLMIERVFPPTHFARQRATFLHSHTSTSSSATTRCPTCVRCPCCR